jgi:hypothetical protein
MATVARGSAADGPAPLDSQPGDERGHQGRSSEIVEEATFVMSSRYGLLLDEAFGMLCALARSQRSSVEEFAASVVKRSGRLDGIVLGDSGEGVGRGQNGSGSPRLLPELLIEAPSAVSAFLLAGSLADYGARAVVEEGIWRVIVDRCSSFSEGTPGALSRTSKWLAACGLATARVTLNGRTYLLDGSANGFSQ